MPQGYLTKSFFEPTYCAYTIGWSEQTRNWNIEIQ